MVFSVELEAYRGPLDLLLFLVRREELDLSSVSLSRVTMQYIAHLEFLEALNLDDVAEFIEVASLLLEMKTKHVLPQTEQAPAGEVVETKIEDPAEELVKRLLEYKRIRDASSILEEQSRRWQLRFQRMANDLPTRRLDPSEQPIGDVELWDLVSAFGRILRENKPAPQANVIYDETPIHVYMKRIHAKVAEQGNLELGDLFEPGMHKSALVGMFLATLELTRHHGLQAKQEGSLSALWLSKGEGFPEHLEVAEVDALSAARVENSNMPVRPR